MASSSKKRQTFAKMTRERAVREKRELKREKKQAAAEARRLGITPDWAIPVGDEDSAIPVADEELSGDEPVTVDAPVTPSSTNATD